MTREEAIKVLTREKDYVQQKIQEAVDGNGYVSPDGLIRADDYVEACTLAISVLHTQEAAKNEIQSIAVAQCKPHMDVLCDEQGKVIVNPVRLRKLVQAEKDGWLPNYTIGDTIYDRFCNAWEVIAAEILLVDGHPEWLYRCGHVGTDDYCALWETEILTHDEAAAALKGGDNNA